MPMPTLTTTGLSGRSKTPLTTFLEWQRYLKILRYGGSVEDSSLNTPSPHRCTALKSVKMIRLFIVTRYQ